jgi:hypothetical protein
MRSSTLLIANPRNGSETVYAGPIFLMLIIQQASRSLVTGPFSELFTLSFIPVKRDTIAA